MSTVESDCGVDQPSLFDGSNHSTITNTQPEVSLGINQQAAAMTDQHQSACVESPPQIPQDSLFPEPQSSCYQRQEQEKCKQSSLGQDNPLSAGTLPTITMPKHATYPTENKHTPPGPTPSTGTAVLEDEREQKLWKANMMAHLVSQSQYSLISCDFCQKPRDRAVSLSCCEVQGLCRACAVMHLIKNKWCWGCGSEATTMDLEATNMDMELGLTEVKSGGILDDAVPADLEERREARKQMADERKRSGESISTTEVTDEGETIYEKYEGKTLYDKMVEEDLDEIRWREVEKTRTDEERVLLAREMFGNPVAADLGPAPSTYDAVLQNQGESEQKPSKDHLVSLISCDFCQKPCHRAVSLPCCQVQGCRACAVTHLTRIKVCWGCGTEATTMHMEMELGLREAVMIVKSGGTLDDSVREDLEERREARKQMTDKRKMSGELISTNDVTDVVDVDINEKTIEEVFDDIGWREQKETRTDKERVLLAKRMFGNAVAADPNRNVTFHGFRAKMRRYRIHLQPSSFEIQSGNLVPLPGFKKVETSGEPSNRHDEYDQLNEENIEIKKIPEVMREVFLKQLQERYANRYKEDDAEELKMFVEHYADGLKETKEFFSFYNLGQKVKQISRERLEEFEDLEKHIGSFPRYYGPTEKTFCQKCGMQHRF